jgi:hypothetical protein
MDGGWEESKLQSMGRGHLKSYSGCVWGGAEMIEVISLLLAWSGHASIGDLSLGKEGPSSRQAGLVGSQGFIRLTLMNKWHPQPLFIYF